ncbi:arginine--tRNA ligase [bacterium]|nr:arginine--tRNA ligase [bacterium]
MIYDLGLKVMTDNYKDAYNKEIDDAIAREKNRVAGSAGAKPEKNTGVLSDIQSEVALTIHESLGIEISPDMALPPSHVGADLAYSAFEAGGKLGQNPAEAAKKIAEAVASRKNAFIENISLEGAFVNFKLRQGETYARILREATLEGERFGASRAHAGEIALIEYSSPNIAKPMSLGHLRSTILGAVLGNLYEAEGFTVIRENYLGDYGTQFGKLLYAYETWEKKDAAALSIEELKNLYVRFHEEAEKNPSLDDHARALFARLESGDPVLGSLWKQFRDISISAYAQMYKRLGVSFDIVSGEARSAKDAGKFAALCLEKGICMTDGTTGAIIVENLAGLPSFVLQKKDESSIYIGRDLATLSSRIENFHPDYILYCVGNEQELNFRQLFALARVLDIAPEDAILKHISFGLVLGESGTKMSTRKGGGVSLEELMNEAARRAEKIIMEKNPALSEEERAKIAEDVGIGSIIWNDLKQSRTKNIRFDWESMLDFEGGSAAYIQYANARIHSIFEKLGNIPPAENPVFAEKIEFELAKKIMFFPRTIRHARETDSPHHLSIYLDELSRLFNAFYAEVSVTGTEDQNLKSSRAILLRAVSQTLENGLKILQIRAPEKM